jgi:hypothetical protein
MVGAWVLYFLVFVGYGWGAGMVPLRSIPARYLPGGSVSPEADLTSPMMEVPEYRWFLQQTGATSRTGSSVVFRRTVAASRWFG